VDILYLAFRFTPTFTAAPNVWDGDIPPQNLVVRQTILGAIWTVLTNSKISTENAEKVTVVVEHARKYWSGPVILFPEATTTNGQAILRCISLLGDFSKEITTRVNILAFKYSEQTLCSVYSVGIFIYQLGKVAARLFNMLEVIHLPQIEVPKHEGTSSAWEDELYTQLSKLLSVKRVVQMSAKDKHDFISYWREPRLGK